MPSWSDPARSGLELRKFVATELLTGRGARALAGRFARNLGMRRVLLVTDPGVEAAGWADAVAANLEAEGVFSVRFSGVTPNPRATEVQAGTEAFLRERCHGLVAVGGGSPMDCAKGIGIVAATGRPILEFEGVDRVDRPIPPLLCVPTTAGSSADVSQFAVITDEASRNKAVIVSKTIVPDVSLVDPEPLTTVPREHAVAAGVDVLVHAFEAFVSNARSALTDALALPAVSLVFRGLPAALADPSDLVSLARVMEGSVTAGLAFSNASLGATHALAHAAGGFVDSTHGQLNAVLLEAVADFNYESEPERYDALATALGARLEGLPGSERRRALRTTLRTFRERLDSTPGLRELGVRAADVPEIAARAERDPCLVTNPRRVVRRDLEVLLEEAL